MLLRAECAFAALVAALAAANAEIRQEDSDTIWNQLIEQSSPPPGSNPCPQNTKPSNSSICFDVFGWVDLTTVQSTQVDRQAFPLTCDDLDRPSNLTFPWQVDQAGMSCSNTTWSQISSIPMFANITAALNQTNVPSLYDEERLVSLFFEAFYMETNITLPSGKVLVDTTQRGIPTLLGAYGNQSLPYNYYVPLRILSSFLNKVGSLDSDAAIYKLDGNSYPLDSNFLSNQSATGSIDPPRIPGEQAFVAFSGVDGSSGGKMQPKLSYCNSNASSTMWEAQNNDYLSFATTMDQAARYVGTNGTLWVWYSSSFSPTGEWSGESEVNPSPGLLVKQVKCDLFDEPLQLPPTISSITAISYIYEVPDSLEFSPDQEKDLYEDMKQAFCKNSNETLDPEFALNDYCFQ